jgi:hypothetical protein
MKLCEYAEAGIAHYWIVTTGGPAIGLDTFRLDGGLYVRSGHAEGGTVTIAEPFAVTLDLDACAPGSCWRRPGPRDVV